MRNKKLKRHKILQDALFLLTSAEELILRAQRCSDAIPDEDDFQTLEKLYRKSLHIQLTATYVESCLHRRLAGKPELPPPWEPLAQ